MLRHALAVLVLSCAFVLVAACDDGDGGDDSRRTCGDGACSQSTCETQQTCPADCGSCQGAGCTPVPTRGSCGEACSTTCDCVSQYELCTADYGDTPGRCVPVGCLSCSNEFDRCDFSPDADGYCASPSCINPPR